MSEKEVRDEEIKEEEKKPESQKSQDLPQDGQIPLGKNVLNADGGPEDSESEGEFMYVDDDFLAEMDKDGDETDDDFKTMKESDLGSEMGDVQDGDILNEIDLQNDSLCQLSLVHQDHVYSVSKVPRAPFNTFVSGDGADKCFVWAVRPFALEDGTKGYKCVKTGELEGHTETVEFIKFNFDGKFCVTGGMNNALRVWAVDEDPETHNFTFTSKIKLENGPSDGEDINVVEWHPKGNAVLCGGKD